MAGWVGGFVLPPPSGTVPMITDDFPRIERGISSVIGEDKDLFTLMRRAISALAAQPKVKGRAD